MSHEAENKKEAAAASEAEKTVTPETEPKAEGKHEEKHESKHEHHHEKAALEAKLEASEKKNEELKNQLLRTAAEYDNYRKRTANEKLSIYDDATAKAVTELLPVADSIQMAITNLKDCDPDILKGIELISNQLAKSFEKLKIESYGKAGDAFDPNLHNAVSKIEDENLGADTIAAVYQTGYKIGDKIIRHAMVQVANCD